MERQLSPPLQMSKAINGHSKLDELLRPIDTLCLEPDDDANETEDIFEEFHRESFLRPYADPNKKYLPKTEADRRTVELFTEDFKRTIRAIREETGLSDCLFDDEAAIEEILQRQETPRSPNPNLSNRGTPIEVDTQQDEESTSSYESNFWRMLCANSSSKFLVSPPMFDAFRQEEKHWLERPHIPWERVEAARVKCKKWLNGASSK